MRESIIKWAAHLISPGRERSWMELPRPSALETLETYATPTNSSSLAFPIHSYRTRTRGLRSTFFGISKLDYIASERVRMRKYLDLQKYLDTIVCEFKSIQIPGMQMICILVITEQVLQNGQHNIERRRSYKFAQCLVRCVLGRHDRVKNAKVSKILREREISATKYNRTQLKRLRVMSCVSRYSDNRLDDFISAA
ncbi:Hypothetical_protein [Hexamita inflata]|uniref:Hypothetical_protein n=1 Tax=Hexamita inflata TaxID=28002 RepID=A0ABP1LM64_9EUKA